MTLRCDGCTSFEKAPNGSGLCHFLPPSQYRDVRNEIWSPFPLVQPDWWCSQHQHNPLSVHEVKAETAPVEHQPAETAIAESPIDSNGNCRPPLALEDEF